MKDFRTLPLFDQDFDMDADLFATFDFQIEQTLTTHHFAQYI